MSEGSGFEICQIIGQNQARIKFFQKSLFGGGYFVFTFYVVNLPYGKFGPRPGGSYGVRGGLSFLVEGKGR